MKTASNVKCTGGADDDVRYKSRIEVAKDVLEHIFPSTLGPKTAFHLIGRREENEAFQIFGTKPKTTKSRCLHALDDDLDFHHLQELKEKWTTDADATYLWEYIYQTIKDLKGKHEIIIITDGLDNDSTERFKGPDGFEEIFRRIPQAEKLRLNFFIGGNDVSHPQQKVYE